MKKERTTTNLGREMVVVPKKDLPEDGEGGLLPGVTLDDSEGLRKLLDEDRAINALR